MYLIGVAPLKLIRDLPDWRRYACISAYANLLSIHANIVWRADADAHLTALNAKYCHGDVCADAEYFTDSTRKY